MCGRFSIASDQKKVEQRFGAKIISPAPIIQRYNIAPSQAIAVITNTAPQEIQAFQWGLIPYWAKDRSIANKLINARAETLSEKPSFKQAYQQRRCLILADSFYEWEKTPNGKQPQRIGLNNFELFAMAGLWEKWVNPSNGELIQSCTIITTEVNEKLKALHHRMPVILHPNDEKNWLDDSLSPSSRQALLCPYPNDAMQYHPISKQVNKVGYDDISLISPITPPPTSIQGRLFD